jgi:phenylalanine ammonia-lyase
MTSFARVWLFIHILTSSLALVSARATITALDVLSQLMASYLLIICQALDLRALQAELLSGIKEIVSEELVRWFNDTMIGTDLKEIVLPEVLKVIRDKLDSTASMDVDIRMRTVADSCSNVFLNYFTNPKFAEASSVTGKALSVLPAFQSAVSKRAVALQNELRTEYLTGKKGFAPASNYLNRTKPLYEFVRVTLQVKMHGIENLKYFENGIGFDEETIGQNVSRVYEVGWVSFQFSFPQNESSFRLFETGSYNKFSSIFFDGTCDLQSTIDTKINLCPFFFF